MTFGPVLSEVEAVYWVATCQEDERRFRHFVLQAVGAGVRTRDTLLDLARRQEPLTRTGPEGKTRSSAA